MATRNCLVNRMATSLRNDDRIAEIKETAARLEQQIDLAEKSVQESGRQLEALREQVREAFPDDEVQPETRLKLEDDPTPPKFTLQWMLIVVFLIAVAMKLQMEFDSAKVCFVCGAAVGAAVFSLARRPLFGVVVGVGVQVLVLIVLDLFFHVRIR